MFGPLIIDEGPSLSRTAGRAVAQLMLVCPCLFCFSDFWFLVQVIDWSITQQPSLITLNKIHHHSWVRTAWYTNQIFITLYHWNLNNFSRVVWFLFLQVQTKFSKIYLFVKQMTIVSLIKLVSISPCFHRVIYWFDVIDHVNDYHSMVIRCHC